MGSRVIAILFFYQHLLFVQIYFCAIIFFATSFPQIIFAQTQNDDGRRQIELELVPSPDAKIYEVELTNYRTKKTLSFKMQKPIWKAQIKPGQYSLRMRSIDTRNVPGAWTSPESFTVQIKKPELLYPLDNIEVIATNSREHAIEFKWTPSPGAARYLLEVTSAAGTAIQQHVKGTTATLILPAANSYTWTVTPFTELKDAGEKDVPRKLTLLGPKLTSPIVIAPLDIWPNEMKWKPVERAQYYSYVLVRKTKKKDKSINEQIVAESIKFTGTKIPIDQKYRGGTYELRVQAHAEKVVSSEQSQIRFKIAHGDRSPEAVEDAKVWTSLEKKTPWYYILSYMATLLNYEGDNPEFTNSAGSKIKDQNMGGTGRIGIGHIDTKKNRGIFGIVDLSGFRTKRDEYITYASAEGHYLWRKYWRRNLIRPSVGIFYKELIEEKPKELNSLDTGFKYKKISTVGPHFGFDVWRPLSQRYGVQVNGRIYYGHTAVKTPNDRDHVPEYSYQYGIMGSYRFSAGIMGLMGWQRREDYATYESTPQSAGTGTSAPDGSKQKISVTGDYLSFTLEWGF